MKKNYSYDILGFDVYVPEPTPQDPKTAPRRRLMETISEVEAKRQEAAAVHAILEFAANECECLYYEYDLNTYMNEWSLRLRVITPYRDKFFEKVLELGLAGNAIDVVLVQVITRYFHDFLA